MYYIRGDLRSEGFNLFSPAVPGAVVGPLLYIKKLILIKFIVRNVAASVIKDVHSPSTGVFFRAIRRVAIFPREENSPEGSRNFTGQPFLV